MTASLEQIHARLEAAVERLTSSEECAAMLRVAARFHSYSLNNQLLIYAQRPDATRAESCRSQRWRQAFPMRAPPTTRCQKTVAPRRQIENPTVPPAYIC